MWESEMYIQDSKTLSTPTTGKSIDKLLLTSKNHGYVMKGFALEAGGALKLLNLSQPAEVERLSFFFLNKCFYLREENAFCSLSWVQVDQPCED